MMAWIAIVMANGIVSEEETMNMTQESEDLFARLKEAASRQRTAEEKREQRVSYIMSAVGRSDDATRKEVESYLDERYGTMRG